MELLDMASPVGDGVDGENQLDEVGEDLASTLISTDAIFCAFCSLTLFNYSSFTAMETYCTTF